MKNKILIPGLILLALAAFFSFKLTEGEGKTSDERKQLVLETVMKAINQAHYSPRELDDSFSKKVYDNILTMLDNEKKLFTKADINELKKYEFTIDDDIKAGNIDFFNKLNDIFSKRVANADKYYKEILDKPFNFNTEEAINIDYENMDFAANEAEIKDRWRKSLKHRSLAKYVDLKKDQDKKRENKDSVNAKFKSDAELEADARKSIRKNQEYYFRRLNKLKEEDRFALYINAILGVEDPHTDFLPPRDKEQFDVAMSGTFYGIGASLQYDEASGNIKVAAIIPGTPCWRQGDLKAGDLILKVGQGKEEPVDITGFDTEDAVKLIRGKKGTEVRLTVKKVNGATQEIPIIRDEVQIEETFAKSAIINTENGPLGYIYLPEFYADFQNMNGRRCSEDVALEIAKLKNANVKGIILDLRYNGGGSLSDVVDMAGLFVDQGPMVQVKAKNGAPMILPDTRAGMMYDGPLAIMVNYGSASASEIMAAAMQDYKRAIIVGTPTFGKGTVQQIKSLDEMLSWQERLNSMASKNEGNLANNSLGAIKLTIQKFYRINGGSTQLKGVVPDIILPDPYEQIEMGERRDKQALKWDVIPPADYKPVSNAVDVPTLATLSRKRIAENSTFSLIKQNAERIKKQEDKKVYSLTETGYKSEQEEANATAKKMEDLQKEATFLKLSNPKEDMARINLDSSSVKKNEDWLKALKKDIYLAETVNIINDMSKMNMKVSMSEK